MRVQVAIEAKQFLDEGHDVIRQTADGQLEWTDGVACLRYTEPGDENGRGARVTVRLLPDGRAELIRNGETHSRLLLEEGRRHAFPYETPWGRLSMGVKAGKVAGTLSPTGGTLRLVYTVDMDGAVTGRHVVNLTATPLDADH